MDEHIGKSDLHFLGLMKVLVLVNISMQEIVVESKKLLNYNNVLYSFRLCGNCEYFRVFLTLLRSIFRINLCSI